MTHDEKRQTRSGFLLMELEWIEPALSLRMDADAPARFASAFADWIQRHTPRK